MEKLHKNIIQAIENLKCSQKFRELNFQPSSYSTLQNKVASMYRITRNGFSMLVMGFTGDLADQFKEAYIEAFEAMEEHIRTLTNALLELDKLSSEENL